jgi:hypothetical protein
MSSQIIAVTPETLPTIVWQNQPVITTNLLAEIYGTVTDNIKKNFERNANRFIEGVHYFLLKGSDLKAFKNKVTNSHPVEIVGKNANTLYLWTERGTVRHAKILDTDNAWAVQDRLEDFYFSKHQSIQYGLKEKVYPQMVAKPHFITRNMERHLKHHVDTLVRESNLSRLKVWRDFNAYFCIDSYTDLPMQNYPAACRYFEIEPIYTPESENNFVYIDAAKLGEIQAEIQQLQQKNRQLSLWNSGYKERQSSMLEPKEATEILKKWGFEVRNVEGGLVDNLTDVSVRLNTGRVVSSAEYIEMLVDSCNEIPTHDLVILPKKLFLELKKALANVF